MMNNRYFYIIALLFTLGLSSGCTSSSQSERKEPVAEDNTYEQTSPSYNYTPASESYAPTPTVQEEPQTDHKMNEVLKVAASTVSKEYQEGYDNGYDDGEDDAVGRNGYRGQYDDSCKYKGKKRREYQRGYEEGYEAGFDDNVADDGSDDEYE